MNFTPYSQGRIEAFKCPKRFWKIYGPGGERVEPVSLYAKAGKEVHDFCRDYYQHLRVAGSSTDLDWVRERREDFRSLLAEDLAEEVVSLVDAFAESHTAPPATSQVEAQLSFDKGKKVVAWNSPECWVRGRLDLVEQNNSTLNITDFKSGRYLPSQKAVEDSFQLKFYSYLAYLAFPGIEEINITLDFVRYQTTRSAKIFAAEIPEMEASILRRIRRIESTDDFPEIVGSQCDRCAFPMECETYTKAGRGSLPLLPADHPEVALEMARELRMIQVKQDGLRAKLKKWVEDQGPVKVGDEVLDYYPQENVSFPDKASVASFLLARGFKKPQIWKAFNLTPTSLKRALGNKQRQRNLIKEVLSLLGQKDITTVFKFKRAEAEEPKDERGKK